jgi:hypothetical protein
MRLGACVRLRVAILVSACNAAVAPAQPIAAANAIAVTVELEPRESLVVIQHHVAFLRTPSARLISPSVRGPDAATPERMTAGEWSDAVGGLRGRLLFTDGGEVVAGTRIGVVYLELQNLSDISNPLEIYDGALSCQLLDGAGRQVEQSHAAGNVMSPLPFWMMLPFDSTLRFRVSVTGYSAPTNGGLSIGLPSGHWLIPPMSRNSYFLSAFFSVTPPKDGDHLHPWKGALKLPKVQIPTNHP